MTARGKPKKADYLLSLTQDLPLAIVEAKDTDHSIGAGLQQAMGYAQSLDIPFAYSSNGHGFVEHDFFTGKERNLRMNEFPSPDELWERYRAAKSLTTGSMEQAVTAPYYYEHGGNTPRYYQRIAVNRTVEIVAKGGKRVLLVMATGTGKTYTAFQIVHRLRSVGVARKVLYLADRNILIDQTKDGDFKPLQKVTTKVEHRKLDPAYEVYFALYQQLVGEDGEEIFRAFDREGMRPHPGGRRRRHRGGGLLRRAHRARWPLRRPSRAPEGGRGIETSSLGSSYSYMSSAAW